MYLDNYRFKNGARDHGSAEVCGLDCLPYRHRTSNKQCRGNDDYATKRNQAPRSKHSPIPADEWVPF